ncbi:MAG: DUF4956 domain-containing protein [Chitinophagales bacterium]|nr:DUF4956 domain-containing protein [Chitinophagales bacterium]
MNLYDQPPLIQFLLKLALDLAVVFLLIGLLYYPRRRDKDYVFTFIVFNVLVFLVCFFMGSLEMSVGLGFGLFALFGILRYRTITVPIKEMTYLFTVIVIAIINALSSANMGLDVTLAADITVLALIFFLEKIWFNTPQGFKVITYEKIENIKPENSQLLLSDLRARTGLDITTIDIETINFLNDTALIKIYFNSTGSEGVRRIAEKD